MIKKKKKKKKKKKRKKELYLGLAFVITSNGA